MCIGHVEFPHPWFPAVFFQTESLKNMNCLRSTTQVTFQCVDHYVIIF